MSVVWYRRTPVKGSERSLGSADHTVRTDGIKGLNAIFCKQINAAYLHCFLYFLTIIIYESLNNVTGTSVLLTLANATHLSGRILFFLMSDLLKKRKKEKVYSFFTIFGFESVTWKYLWSWSNLQMNYRPQLLSLEIMRYYYDY